MYTSKVLQSTVEFLTQELREVSYDAFANFKMGLAGLWGLRIYPHFVTLFILYFVNGSGLCFQKFSTVTKCQGCYLELPRGTI